MEISAVVSHCSVWELLFFSDFVFSYFLKSLWVSSVRQIKSLRSPTVKLRKYLNPLVRNFCHEFSAGVILVKSPPEASEKNLTWFSPN